MRGIKTMLVGIIVICYGIFFVAAKFGDENYRAFAFYFVMAGTLIAFVGLFIKDKK